MSALLFLPGTIWFPPFMACPSQSHSFYLTYCTFPIIGSGVHRRDLIGLCCPAWTVAASGLVEKSFPEVRWLTCISEFCGDAIKRSPGRRRGRSLFCRRSQCLEYSTGRIVPAGCLAEQETTPCTSENRYLTATTSRIPASRAVPLRNGGLLTSTAG